MQKCAITLFRTLQLGCAGFGQKIFSLQSETKRNEIRFACVSHAHVKKKFFASFCFISLLIFRFRSKRNEQSVFSLCFASKIFSFCFVSLPIKVFSLFCLISFSFRFRCGNKRKKHFFASKRKKFCFHFASKQKWWHFFASVSLHFASKRKWWEFLASVLLYFASKRKWLQFFFSFSFCFRFVPFSFRFRFRRFASMRNKRKKHFFRIEVKKISLPFRFISLWSENDGPPYVQ